MSGTSKARDPGSNRRPSMGRNRAWGCLFQGLGVRCYCRSTRKDKGQGRARRRPALCVQDGGGASIFACERCSPAASTTRLPGCSVCSKGHGGSYTCARPFRRFAFWPSPPMPAGRRTQNHTQTLTHKQDEIRMKSPRHLVMQAAEPFSDPAGTHCAGATDGANVSDDASLHHRAVWSTNGPLWLGDK